MDAKTRELVIAGLSKAGLLQDEHPTNAQLLALIADFQLIHGLKIDSEPGPVTLRTMDRWRFCAVPDRIALDAKNKCRWDHTLWTGTGWNGTPAPLMLTYFVEGQFSGLSKAVTDAAFAEALRYWSEVCAIIFEPVTSAAGANLHFEFGSEQAGGVLAFQYLPCGNDSPSTTLKGWYDNAEQWIVSGTPQSNKIDAVRVVCHEVGHGIGLDHGPEGALLAPYYDRNIRKPQDWDIREAQFRYGPPIVNVPPVPSDKKVKISFGAQSFVTSEQVTIEAA